MDSLLVALGWPTGLFRRLGLIAQFAVLVAVFLTVRNLGPIPVGWTGLATHAGGWTAWFVWQGWLFSRNRERYLRADPRHAYRRAFYRDILPGVSFGVTQMLVPVSHGLLAGALAAPSLPRIISVLLFFGIGLLLLLFGFKAIGVAGAGFLFEYQPISPSLVQRGVYASLRHPLFLGGVVASTGVCLLFNESWWSLMAALNLAVLPVYARLEDARLVRVFGQPYAVYREAVPAFAPRMRAVFVGRTREVANMKNIVLALVLLTASGAGRFAQEPALDFTVQAALRSISPFGLTG